SLLSFVSSAAPRAIHSFPTRRSSDLALQLGRQLRGRLTHVARSLLQRSRHVHGPTGVADMAAQLAEDRRYRERRQRLAAARVVRSEEHTSELQSRGHLVCRLLLEKKK